MTIAFAAFLGSGLTLVVIRLSRLRAPRSSVFDDRVLWAFPVLFCLCLGAIAAGVVIGDRLATAQCVAVVLERTALLVPLLKGL